MGFQLEPITIAAIGSAGFTVSLVVFLIARRLLLPRSDTSDTSSQLDSRSSVLPSAPSHSPRRASYPYINGYGQGYGQGTGSGGNAYGQSYGAGREYRSASLPGSGTGSGGTGPGVTPSPSTGHTTLVTPSTAGGKAKLKKGVNLSPGWAGSKEHDESGSGGGKPKKKGGDELVVVTYEDGLRKLGIEPIPMGEDSPYTPSHHHHHHHHHEHSRSHSQSQSQSHSRSQSRTGRERNDRWAPRIEIPASDGGPPPITPYSGGTGVGAADGSTFDSDRYRNKPLPLPSGTSTSGYGLERSPSSATVLSSARSGLGRGGIGRVRIGTDGTMGTFGLVRSGTLKSTWLPSYYQVTKGGKDEVDLGDTR